MFQAMDNMDDNLSMNGRQAIPEETDTTETREKSQESNEANATANETQQKGETNATKNLISGKY